MEDAQLCLSFSIVIGSWLVIRYRKNKKSMDGSEEHRVDGRRHNEDLPDADSEPARTNEGNLVLIDQLDSLASTIRNLRMPMFTVTSNRAMGI